MRLVKVFPLEHERYAVFEQEIPPHTGACEDFAGDVPER